MDNVLNSVEEKETAPVKKEDKTKLKNFNMNDILPTLRDRFVDAEVVDYLKENHLPLLWLLGTNGESNISHDSQGILSAAYQAQLDEYSQSRGHFEAFNRSLREHNIDYVLIKSVGIPPSFPWESDNIDIFFLEKDVPKVKDILLELGYLELKHIKEMYKILFRKFDSGTSVSAIHVHSNVGWESVPFVDLEKMWKNKRTAADDNQITIPGPEDAFLITVAHAQYENKKIRLADFIRLVHLVTTHNLEWDYIFDLSSKRGWQDGFTKHLQVVNSYSHQIYGADLVPLNSPSIRYTEPGFKFELTNFPYKFKFRENVKLWYSKIRKDEYISKSERKRQTYYSTTRMLKRKINRYKRIQPVYYVGIGGIDGTGKTLQSELLNEALTISEVYTRYIWIRGAVVRSMELINKLLKRGVSENQGNGQVSRGDEKTRKKILNNKLLSFVYKSIIFVETLSKFNCKIRWAKLRRKVIISDRTIYDALVDLGIKFDDEYIFDRLFSKMLIWLTPKPDQVFMLEADRELILKRKEDELDEDLLNKKLALYRQLKNRYDFKVIDSHLSIDHIHQKILSCFFDDFFKKYQGKFYKIVNPS